MFLTFEEANKHVFDSYGRDITPVEFEQLAGINQLFASKMGRLMDANESLATLRALTKFTNKVYEIKLHAEHKFHLVLPMLSETVEMGVKTLGWHTSEDIGKFGFQANGAQNSNILSKDWQEKTVDIKLASAMIKWTWEDIAAAIFQGRNLPADLAAVARRSSDVFNDETTAVGSSNYNVDGLLSNPTAMTSYGTLGWSGLSTALAKSNKLKDVIRRVLTVTGSTYSAQLLILPPTHYAEIEDTPMGDNADKSILDELENTYRRRGLKIVDWHRFEDVTATGIGSNKDVVMALPFTPEVAENCIIDPFFMKPPIPDGYDMKAGAYVRTAGVVKRNPKAMVWGTLD